MADLPTAGRWEWRVFGDDLPALVPALDAGPVQASEEVYLLSPHSDASVKLRGGLLDVKELQAVRPDGLEQWLPVLKTPLPLDADAAARALAALGVDARPGPVPDIDALAAAAPGLEGVRVRKGRRRHTVDGCMAELTEIAVGERATWTVAVEADDPELVLAALRALGLAEGANVSVARGVKALAGFGAPRFAVIDVGTNSVKFVLAARADGGWRTLVDRAAVTRLGEGLERTGDLGEQPIERTVAAVADMVEEARAAGVDGLAAVGTAGLRIAANASEFLARVRERTGVEVEVIPGSDEARLAYVAATAGLAPASGSLVVFDTGGGSSQFSFGDVRAVAERFSVNVGAVRFTERFGLDGAVSEETLAELLAALASELGRLGGRGRPDAVIGMGGANTNLAAVMHGLADYDPDVVHGSTLDRAEIDRQIELYRTRTADERRAITGLQPNRAEVILAGACIVRTVLELLGAESLIVSDRGLRHGLLVERFSERAL